MKYRLYYICFKLILAFIILKVYVKFLILEHVCYLSMYVRDI